MATISVQIPDIILESHHHNLETVRNDLQQGFVIWEYLNGHLSFQECGKLLNIGYRGFLELLWSTGIPIDGLNDEEITQQISNLRKVIN